jgi:biopolymer transport protein ExbD
MPLVLTKRIKPMHGLVDLAPVVSVVLLLLCFFLLSSSFVLQSGIKVEPPRSTFSVDTPSSRLIVAVTLAPQQYDADGKPLQRETIVYFNDQVVTLDGLRAALDQLPVGHIPPSLVVKADKDVPFNTISSIIDVAHKFPVVIATQPATQPATGNASP